MSGYERSSDYDRGEVARRNDAFRRDGDAHLFMVTPGVLFLPDFAGVLQAVRDYDDFTEANDPHKEHDFGAFWWAGEQVFWKIDYYDPTERFWCDPLDDACRRVLTIMTADEY